MDEIGSEIGATPSLWTFLLKDLFLWYKLVFGCWTPHHYRLQGPDPWQGARSEIIHANSGYDYRTWNGF